MNLMDRIMDVATRAGYRIENDDDVHKAILAYSSAVTLIEQRRPRSLKLGRNDPCPCGSGRKYKKCCLSAHEKAPPDAPLPGQAPGPDRLAPSAPRLRCGELSASQPGHPPNCSS